MNQNEAIFFTENDNDIIKGNPRDLDKAMKESFKRSGNDCIICIGELPKDYEMEFQYSKMFAKECQDYGHSNMFHVECWKEYLARLPTKCAICQRPLNHTELNDVMKQKKRNIWRLAIKLTLFNPWVVFSIGFLVYRFYIGLKENSDEA
jgi:hypothetical protein